MPATANDKHRFWSKVIKSSLPDGCWLWIGAVQDNGYGRFKFEDKIHLAHRISWLFTYGEWPEPCCLHKCDVRNCVSTFHLFEGSYSDNNSDCISKGRGERKACKGEASHLAKVTEEQVREIRQLSVSRTHVSLGLMFGLTPAVISKIVNRVTWTHI